jgi:CRISPR-associated protein Csx10
VSYPYVPGSQVRGAVIAAFLRSTQINTLDAADEDHRRLFFNGKTRYLNAYPLTPDGVRALPTPLSWHTVKNEDQPIYDFALGVRYTVNGKPKQFTRVAGGERTFCRLVGDQVVFAAPERQINVHTQRDRSRGRAVEGSGAVFQYDALAEGEQFCGCVLVQDAATADDLAKLMASVAVIGGSSNSGYGKVRVEVEPPIDAAEMGWREVSEDMSSIPANSLFTITLLSPLLTRDQNSGQYTTAALAELERALGVTLRAGQGSADADEMRSAWHVEEVGGFNRKWGLPLVQAQALSAGSVLVCTSKEGIGTETIQAVEWRGVGERRVEGFGRLVFNWQTELQLWVNKSTRTSAKRKAPILTGIAQAIGERMAERLLRQELDNALQRRVNALSIDKPPSNAQLSRFRVIAREALADKETDRLLRFLADIDSRRSARDQFQRARISQQRLTVWLENRLSEPETIWEQLGTIALVRRVGANVSKGVADDEALAREYTVRLIDGVLAKATRVRREQEEDEE